MHLHRLPILLALLLPISALAQADPGKMTVDVGWGNAYRAGTVESGLHHGQVEPAA
jgi:hypothetical protein